MRNSAPSGGGSGSRRKPVRVTHPVLFWVCCDSLVQVLTHYDGRRTAECEDKPDHPICWRCQAEYPRKLENWLAVQDERVRNRPTLLHITANGIETGVKLWEHNGDLYGRLIRVARRNNVWNGPMTVTEVTTQDSVRLAPPVDVLARLRKMWAAPSRPTSNDNPECDRQYAYGWPLKEGGAS